MFALKSSSVLYSYSQDDLETNTIFQNRNIGVKCTFQGFSADFTKNYCEQQPGSEFLTCLQRSIGPQAKCLAIGIQARRKKVNTGPAKENWSKKILEEYVRKTHKVKSFDQLIRRHNFEKRYNTRCSNSGHSSEDSGWGANRPLLMLFSYWVLGFSPQRAVVITFKFFI